MADIAGAPSSSTLLRWTTLIVIAANIAFIAVYAGPEESPTIAQVMAEYGNSLVPANFVKAMCALLLAAILSFYVVALWPSRHRKRFYNSLVVPLALTSVLASIWIVAIRNQAIGLSVALIAAGVVLGAFMFARVASVSPGRHSRWLRVPFSLFFGAMTIALLIALTKWLHTGGLLATAAVAPDDVTAAFLAIAAATGGYVALRYSDFVYPAVITSGAGAIFVAQRAHDPFVAADALAVCIGMLVVAALAAVALARTPRRDGKDKASPMKTRTERRKQDSWGYALDANSSIMRL
jgi:hypothetical protein